MGTTGVEWTRARIIFVDTVCQMTGVELKIQVRFEQNIVCELGHRHILVFSV